MTTLTRNRLLKTLLSDPHTGAQLSLSITPSGPKRWRATALIQHPTKPPKAITQPRTRTEELPAALAAMTLFISTAEIQRYLSGATAQAAITLLTLTTPERETLA